MTKRYFEFVEGSSNKFWEVWREGTAVNTRYGKIGAGGQTTIKNEGSEPAAEKLWLKLIGEKTKKGYVEKGATKVAAAPKAAAPVAKPVAVTKPAAGAKATALKGKTVVVTGTFSRPRKELEKLLVTAGNTIGGSVTAKTDLLLVGTDAGSKLAQAQKLGRKSFPELSFAKSLRVVDQHSGYHPIAFALIDQPANPRIGMGDDHGADWEGGKVTDFETFITTVLKNDADARKMDRWFGRG